MSKVRRRRGDGQAFLVVEKCLLRTITSIAIRPKASLGQNLIKHY